MYGGRLTDDYSISSVFFCIYGLGQPFNRSGIFSGENGCFLIFWLRKIVKQKSLLLYGESIPGKTEKLNNDKLTEFEGAYALFASKSIENES